jgi:hypothetical protein
MAVTAAASSVARHREQRGGLQASVLAVVMPSRHRHWIDCMCVGH